MLRPDFTVRDESDTVRVVGDAKWKVESPKNTDFYQMAAYELAHDAPGLLVYPEQEVGVESKCRLPDGRRLWLIELPTDLESESLEKFQFQMKYTMREAVDEIIDIA